MMVRRKDNTNLLKMVKKMIGLKKVHNLPTDHSKKGSDFIRSSKYRDRDQAVNDRMVLILYRLLVEAGPHQLYQVFNKFAEKYVLTTVN